MSQDERELLQLLRFELNYLEQGGFQPGHQSPFRGTIACINSGDPVEKHTCRECLLYAFVPENKHSEDLPCHHIRLNAAGDTIASLAGNNDSLRLTAVLVEWLRTTIAHLEAAMEPHGRS